MGWDGTYPTHYKKGKVDRKAECDKRFTWETEDRIISVVKSQVVGTTYYGAIKEESKKDGSSNVTAAICLTRMDRDGMFMVKSMHETEGPYVYTCPKSILDLLTPIDSEWANKWRNKCRENSMKPKLSDLPEGTKIQFTCPFETTYYHEGDIITLEKKLKHNWKRKTYAWISDGYIRWGTQMIPDNYVLL